MIKSLSEYHGHTVERLLPRSTPIRHHQSLLDTIGQDRIALHHDSGYFVFNPPLPADTPHNAPLAITQPHNQPEQSLTQSEGTNVDATKLTAIQDALASVNLKANDYYNEYVETLPELAKVMQMNDPDSEMSFLCNVLDTIAGLIDTIDNQIGGLPETGEYYENDTTYY